MPAAVLPITIEVGADYAETWAYSQPGSGGPVDLTAYTAKLLVSNKSGVLLTALSTDEPSFITLGGVLGTVAIAIPGATTAKFPGVAYDVFPAGGAFGQTSYGSLPYTMATAHYTLILTSGPGAVTYLTTGPVTFVMP